MRNRFDSLARVGWCRRPVLMVHGTRDRMVPFHLGEQLFAAANAPKRLHVVQGAGHNDTVLEGFFGELRRFLGETEQSKAKAEPATITGVQSRCP